MKSIFICSTSRYPHGSPGAQRIHYIAKILKAYGMTPYIITNGENIPSEYDEQRNIYSHNGIDYRNVTSRKGSLKDLLNRANMTINVIKQIGYSEGDYLLVCTAIPFFGKGLFIFAKNNGMVSMADKTEWFQPEQFHGGRFDPFYILANYYFNHTMLKADKIIVISEILKKHFQEKKKAVFCIPIVTDAADYQFSKRKSFERIRFIYPGNPGNKDDFRTLLKGISLLSAEDKSRMEFHLTSVKEKDVLRYIESEEDYNAIKDVIVYHGWMEYNELMKLYSISHYTIIVKKDNKVTKANFPSKVPELMACGVVPVITAYGDIRNYISVENSIFIEECTPEKVKSALENAINLDADVISAMSYAARKCAETVFDFHSWVDKFGRFVYDS